MNQGSRWFGEVLSRFVLSFHKFYIGSIQEEMDVFNCLFYVILPYSHQLSIMSRKVKYRGVRVIRTMEIVKKTVRITPTIRITQTVRITRTKVLNLLFISNYLLTLTYSFTCQNLKKVDFTRKSNFTVLFHIAVRISPRPL